MTLFARDGFESALRPTTQERKSRPAVATITLLLAAAALLLGAAHASARTVVTLTFDDGTASQYAARTMLSNHGMHGVFYVNSGRVGANGYLTQAQLLNLQSDGNEIAGHTVSHSDLPAQPLDEQQRQICDDRVALLGMGLHITDFAYPYGDENATTDSAVAGCGYNSGRTVGGIVSPGTCANCAYAESVPPANPYAIRTPDSIKQSTTLTEMKNLVSQAEWHGGGWVVLVIHQICDGASCDDLSIGSSTLNSFLDWLSLRWLLGTVVQTAHDVVGGAEQPGVAGPPPPTPASGPNVLLNPSLEASTLAAGTPDCFTLGGFGNNTASWTRTTDAHTGFYAERVNITAYTDGDRKLVTKQDLGSCAPAVRAGHTYNVSVWYKSNVATRLVAYTRSGTGGWSFWAQSGSTFPASTTWRQATWTTPVVPVGASALSVGQSLRTVGTLTMDDFGFADSDQTPPTVALTSPKDGSRIQGVVDVTADATDNAGVDHVDFLLDGRVIGTDSTAPYRTTLDTSALPGSVVALTARAVDTAGNTASSSAMVTVQSIDTVPPVSTIDCDGAPCAAYYSAPVSVALSATDDNSGVADIYYTLDGTDPTVASQVYSGPIAIGSNATIKYRAIDAAGNLEAVHSQSIAFDSVAPATTASCDGGACSASAYGHAVSVSLAASDNASGVTAIRYTTDGSDPTAASADFLAAGGPLTFSSDTVLKYRAYDAAGNVEPVRTRALSIDTVAPASYATCGGSPCAPYRGADPVNIELHADDTGSGVAAIRYTTDGSDPTAFSDAYSAPIAATAPVTLKFRAYDAAGNAEVVHALNIGLDVTPPASSVSCDGAACSSGYYGHPVQLTLSATDDASGVAAIRYTLDGSDPTTSSPSYDGAPLTMAAGTTTVKFRAYDAVGNAEAIGTQVVNVDTTPPQSAIACNGSPCGSATYSPSVTVALSATDDASGVATIRYTTDGTDPGPASAAYTAPFTLVANATVKYRAYDAAGNAEAVRSQALQVEGLNLLANPSLESAVASKPTCWRQTGYGTNSTTWTYTTDAHDGLFAQQMQVDSISSGNVKFVSTQDAGTCAPAGTPGHTYTFKAWYKSDKSPRMVAYYRDSAGVWQWWAQGAVLPAAAAWTKTTWTTPALPAGATRVSFGFFLSTTGTLTMDDFSLTVSP